MTPTRTLQRFRDTSRMTVMAFAVLGSTMTNGFAGESGCKPPDHPSGPSAGEWKGYFRLIYEITFPGPAKLVVPTRIEGDLDFSLGRQQLDDPPAPPSPPPPAPPPPQRNLRKPLRAPSAAPSPGQPNSPATPPPAPPPGPPSDLQLAVSRVEADYNGLYVPPGKGAQLQGTSNLTMDAGFDAAVSQDRLKGDLKTKQPIQLEVIGEEDPLTSKFEEIGLWGPEGLGAFHSNFLVTSPDGKVSGNTDFSPASGGSGHAVATSKKRRDEADFSIPPARELPPGVVQETESQRERRQFDEDYDRLFGKPKPKRKYLTLKVDSTECWLMRGTVDTTEMVANMTRGGLTVVIKESEWMVMLDERDPAFEERIQALADEPIPGRLTAEYLRSYNARSQALMREANSDYKRCVARGLEEKFMSLNAAALQSLMDDFPASGEGVTCAVISASLPQIMTHMRVLQLFGLGDCSVVREAESKLEKLVQDRVKITLAGQEKDPFWSGHMDCLSKFFESGLVDFGDQAERFEQAWDAASAARKPVK